MATFYSIHPETPQRREIDAVRDALRQGAVILYPTDTVYAIGCDLNEKSAVQKVRQLKQLANDKPLTFLCDSLSNVADYAQVNDPAYKLIRRLIPGPYTFLLPASRQVPRLVMNPKRKTTGIRVPDSPIALELLKALGNPIISTSALPVATLHGGSEPEYLAKAELFDRMDALVDVIIDNGQDLQHQMSSIVDLTVTPPLVRRQGLGWEAAIAWGAEVS